MVVHLGAKGAGYYSDNELITEPHAPLQNHLHTTGTGDVLSVCMMLLHRRTDITIRERLRLANAIVAEFMDGRRTLIPCLGD